MTPLRPLAALLAVSCSLAGCSGESLKTHTVRGVVKLPGGDVALLTGSLVEFRQAADPLLHSSGKIAADGSFTMQTLHGGQVHTGVPAGTYQARIILADESDEGVPKRGGRLPMHRRFLDFDSSQLSFEVPGGDYTVTLSSK